MALFLITAPSGAGKTTLAQAIAKYGDWEECISHTTRPMRDGEINGKTYYFVEEGDFADSDQMEEFAEKVVYKGNYYGVSKDEIKRVMNKGKHVFVIVENDGYNQMKKHYPDAIGIFLHMSKEDCMANMLLRGDSIEGANDRIELYDEEISNRGEYDYVVKNVRNKQKQTEDIIRAIIRQHNPFYTAYIDTSPFITQDIGVSIKKKY